MNKNEQIRKYLDGELTGEELKNFETEINNSPELKNLVDSYRDTLNQFKKIENVNSEESYFINIVPRFHESMRNKKRLKLKPAFAFSSIALVLTSILLVFILNKDNQVINPVHEISSEELSSYLKSNPQDYYEMQLTESVPQEYDSLFNSIFFNELNIDDNSGKYLVDVTGNEFYNILDEISDEDAESIYSSLISKKIY
ncbi:MAG: hypothetical protein A2057_09755 [Ignavibacteria bacterium GWA2_35_9]|nr:MAG: hypothetical protein A2057_09755 [Ignavibacteria bacterium GWA2_35_9]OGU52123.1 MAG: hypothetical protein A2080_03720 [Ignavibacteria bacterium GWC2_36_12]OGV10516.1 MAG: hypothetical protein A2330_11910 [Ignavibacteria bacterium RIFOXYB2_FULL_36_7]